MAYDIIIKSGTVFDGTGKPGEKTDIGVKGDKISALGNLSGASANVVIDAWEKYVTPGFVDVTNHSDTHLTIFKYPDMESLAMQGITTVIGGNCGSSLAPLGSKQAIKSISKWVNPEEINVNWATVEEFLGEVERARPGVNFGTLLGFGTLRRGVIGDESRPLGQEELEAMNMLISKGLDEGAFGVSFGLAYGHERVSGAEEIAEIGKIVSKKGGLMKFHLRSEGKGLLASVNETIRISRDSSSPVHISHFKAIGRKSWDLSQKALDLIEHSGADITLDVSPYNTTGSPLYSLIPEGMRYGGFSELLRRISSKEDRARMAEALKSHTLHYDKILITSAKTKTVIGKTLAEVAERAGMSPEDAMLETLLANEGRVAIIGKTVSIKNARDALLRKRAFISSDGYGLPQESYKTDNLTHPRSFGAFPHFWHKFVIDEKAIPPEEAVKKMTHGPAERFGIKKRGALLEGNFADIAVFDPKLFRDRGSYLNPYRFPAGMDWVIVNGAITVEQGRYHSSRAGKALRR